jgi:hypothetical protein
MYSENLTHNTFNQSGVAITERTQGTSNDTELGSSAPVIVALRDRWVRVSGASDLSHWF